MTVFVDRQVAAVVASMSASISGAADSAELALLQQRLLWLLRDRGALAAYPLAICTLAGLEEHRATPDRPKPLELLREAVTVARVRENPRDRHRVQGERVAVTVSRVRERVAVTVARGRGRPSLWPG